MAETGLPEEIWAVIIRNLEIGDLGSSLFVSQAFGKVAHQIFLAHYGIQHDGIVRLNFTSLARRLDAVARNAFDEGYETTQSKAQALLKGQRLLDESREYACLKSLLESKFGHCIAHKAGQAPCFHLDSWSLDIFDDGDWISLVPHLLSESNPDWPEFYRGLCGLVERERVDLVKLIELHSRRPIAVLSTLLGAKVPRDVIKHMHLVFNTRRLQEEDRNLMALLGYELPLVSSNLVQKVPIVALWSLQQNGLVLPQCHHVCDGLSVAAIPFWIDFFKNKPDKMLELLQEKGDESVQKVLKSLEEQVGISTIDRAHRDVYQALLIYLHSSKMNTPAVDRNYASMFARPAFGFHSLCALFHCKKDISPKEIADYGCKLEDSELLAFTVKLYQSKRLDLVAVCAGRLVENLVGLKFAKSLVLRNADDSYIQTFLRAIGRCNRPHALAACFCMPLETLKQIASMQNLSVSNAEEMLSGIRGYDSHRRPISRELQVVQLLIFWEAPETVVAHYIAQLPRRQLIAYEIYEVAVLSKKYSDEFISSCFKRFEGPRFERDVSLVNMYRPGLARKFSEYRHALAEELGILELGSDSE